MRWRIVDREQLDRMEARVKVLSWEVQSLIDANREMMNRIDAATGGQDRTMGFGQETGFERAIKAFCRPEE